VEGHSREVPHVVEARIELLQAAKRGQAVQLGEAAAWAPQHAQAPERGSQVPHGRQGGLEEAELLKPRHEFAQGVARVASHRIHRQRHRHLARQEPVCVVAVPAPAAPAKAAAVAAAAVQAAEPPQQRCRDGLRLLHVIAA